MDSAQVPSAVRRVCPRPGAGRHRRAAAAVGWILALAAVVVIAGGVWLYAARSQGADADAARPEPRSPNVVIFLIDTLRADRMSTYGYPKPTSPLVDAIAKESVVFEQANSPAPWTLPSVTCMMTSTFTCENGVVMDGQKISLKLKTLAERLKSVGYSTGSFIMNPYAGAITGLDRGFDTYTEVPPTRPTEGTRIAAWLDEHPQAPFFLYIHNMSPHDPYQATKDSVRLFGDVSRAERAKVDKHSNAYRVLTRIDFASGKPLGTTDNTEQQVAEIAALDALRPVYEILYDGAVRDSDNQIGSVAEVLRRRGLWDDTLFIIVADHGEEFGEHGGWMHDQSVYQELIHVPLIMKFPDGEFGGQRIPDLVGLTDILPTLFDYQNRPELAEGARGISLMPLITGEQPDREADFIVSSMRVNRKKYFKPWTESRGDLNVVIRQANWKGIWNADVNTFELYDLAADPGEQHNVYADHPDLGQALYSFVKPWFETCAAGEAEPSSGGIESLPEDARQKLMDLGYIGTKETLEAPGSAPTSRPGGRPQAP